MALTRAKEKLIMTGGLTHAEDTLKSLMQEMRLCKRGKYTELIGGGSFLEWILGTLTEEPAPFKVRFVSLEELVAGKTAQILEKKFDYESFLAKKEAVPESLRERFTYEYPFEQERRIPGKVSVSELKMEAMEEETLELLEKPEMIPYIPAFLREELGVSATERGNAYHRVMECMELSGIRHSDQVRERIEQLVLEGKMTSVAAKTVNPYDIYLFCRTGLCQRMLKAQSEGGLFKEQPFVIARAAREISPEYDSDREILIQGIMDAWFEEEDGLVLLDYKTDRIKTDQELILRYHTQLEVYGKALEQMTGKKVKERCMYSFCLGREIYV